MRAQLKDKRPEIEELTAQKPQGWTTEPPRVQADVNEMHCLEMLLAVDATLRTDAYQAGLKRRCLLVDGSTWRQLRQISGSVQKLTEKLLTTIPEKQLKQLLDMIHNYRFAWQRKTYTVDGVIDCDTQDLSVLVNQVMQDNCAMCLKEPGEENRCAVRHALMGLCHCKKTDRSGPCPYHRVALNADYGNYIEEK